MWEDSEGVFARVMALAEQACLEKETLEARGERAWCVFKCGRREEARTLLEEVIALLDAQEGRSFEQARAWWRLSACFWAMGGEYSVLNGHFFTRTHR